MPTYQFTVTDFRGHTHAVTVTGPFASSDAHILADTYRKANGATVTHPVWIERADTDPVQPDADGPVGDGPG